MSLLKRLNGPAAGESSTGALPPASGTGSIGTGELFGRPTGPIGGGPTTGDLFASPTPPQTAPVAPKATSVLAAAQPAEGRGGRSGSKGDGFNELKARVQNRLIAELDPRMDLGNAGEVRRTV